MRHWLVPRGPHPLNQWFNGFDTLHEDIDRWFDDFSKGVPGMENLEKYKFGAPRVELYETETEVVVSAELPGVENNDLDVRVHDREVIIKAEKKKEEEIKDDKSYRSERFYGSIYRSVPLPVDVDADKAKASFKNGILKLTLPKMVLTEKGKKLIIEE